MANNSGVMTLDELKAANAEQEAAAEVENVAEELDTESPPQADEVEEDAETVEDELEETTEDAESEEEETGEDDTEDWMQSDSHESQAEKKFTDGDIGKAKAKLRAKLEKRHEDEVEKLRAELEALKGGKRAEPLAKPKREDFYDEDDPDEAYFDALTDWKLKTHQAEVKAETQSAELTRKQQEVQQATAKAVDQHYERAVGLSAKSGISAELYQSADYKVRQMVESLYPGAGDNITDALIASMGDGSEKVMYNLGINESRLGELRTRLEQDKNGIKAAIFLGQLNERLSAPQKRKTNAPKPAADAHGDVQAINQKALKKKYDAASKSGNTQAAFDARREARKAGVDTSNW